MPYVELGKILKPHGFKGALVASMHSGSESAIGGVAEVRLGKDESTLSAPYRVLEAAWMPKGWKLVLEGIESEAQVELLRGLSVFVQREHLPTLPAGEYYLSDLEGCRVLDEKGKDLGVWSGSESLPGQERWWITGAGGAFAVPATKRFIKKVDTAAKVIHLQNLEDFVGEPE